MDNPKQLAKQVAKVMRAGGVVTYDQTRYIFKLTRQELDLSPTKSRGRSTVKHLGTEQLRKFKRAAYRHSAERGLMMDMLYETAVRVSEFIKLRAEDLLFEDRRLVIRHGKGDKRREVPITQELATAIRLYLGQRTQGPIFKSRLDKAYSRHRINQIVNEVASEAGLAIKVTPHTLRHTRATQLVQAGMTRDELKPMLGHEKSDTTDIYTRTAAVLTTEAYDRAVKQLHQQS